MRDQILINELELTACIGVPEEERAAPQRLTVSLILELRQGLTGLREDISRTVDYARVAKIVQAEALRRPRRLIETLAEEITQIVLQSFERVSAVEVVVHKYILPDAASVAVRLRRER